MGDAKTPANSRYYYYSDKWQVLAEHDLSDSFEQRYVYGNYIDETLCIDDGDDQYFYIHDQLFSTAALVDDTGAVKERYEYDAYGKTTVLDSNFDVDADGLSDYNNPYLFTGRRLDILDSGSLTIYYYRHRNYDPDTGRFLQHDPKGYVDGMNMYQYVRGNPLLWLDPMGLNVFEDFHKFKMFHYAVAYAVRACNELTDCEKARLKLVAHALKLKKIDVAKELLANGIKPSDVTSAAKEMFSNINKIAGAFPKTYDQYNKFDNMFKGDTNMAKLRGWFDEHSEGLDRINKINKGIGFIHSGAEYYDMIWGSGRSDYGSMTILSVAGKLFEDGAANIPIRGVSDMFDFYGQAVSAISDSVGDILDKLGEQNVLGIANCNNELSVLINKQPHSIFGYEWAKDIIESHNTGATLIEQEEDACAGCNDRYLGKLFE